MPTDRVHGALFGAAGRVRVVANMAAGYDNIDVEAATERMFDAGVFARIQPHAILVNTARGGVVDQPALARAPGDGVIGGAALDATTPLPLDDLLLEAPNLPVAPRSGSATGATRTTMAELAVDGLLAALAGERPEHLVNSEALERRR